MKIVLDEDFRNYLPYPNRMPTESEKNELLFFQILVNKYEKMSLTILSKVENYIHLIDKNKKNFFYCIEKKKFIIGNWGNQPNKLRLVQYFSNDNKYKKTCIKDLRGKESDFEIIWDVYMYKVVKTHHINSGILISRNSKNKTLSNSEKIDALLNMKIGNISDLVEIINEEMKNDDLGHEKSYKYIMNILKIDNEIYHLKNKNKNNLV